jgi:hypothetical protein
MCLAAVTGPILQHGGMARMGVRTSARLLHYTLCLMWKMLTVWLDHGVEGSAESLRRAT